MIRLTLEMNGETTVLVVPEGEYCSLDKFLTLIPRLCVGGGWMPGSFPDAMHELNDWVETLEKDGE